MGYHEREGGREGGRETSCDYTHSVDATLVTVMWEDIKLQLNL